MLKENRALAARLVTLGRHAAYERVAYFVCDLLDRLQAIGQAQDGSFVLHLTQSDLADLLGLSTVHINRSLQALKKKVYSEV